MNQWNVRLFRIDATNYVTRNHRIINQSIPKNEPLPEKLIIANNVKKFSIFCITQKIIPVFTKVRH